MLGYHIQSNRSVAKWQAWAVVISDDGQVFRVGLNVEGCQLKFVLTTLTAALSRRRL